MQSAPPMNKQTSGVSLAASGCCTCYQVQTAYALLVMQDLAAQSLLPPLLHASQVVFAPSTWRADS